MRPTLSEMWTEVESGVGSSVSCWAVTACNRL
nr:MAG TPA: hypothetical protein [Caudoviricetes sp.]